MGEVLTGLMASPRTALLFFLHLLQVCLVCGLSGQTGQAISTKSNFQAFRNLVSLRCNAKEVIGTGGRAGDLLDTTAKLDAFAATLTADQRTFFNQIRTSAAHSFSPFTADEARSTFLFLYNYLNEEGKNYYLNIRTIFDQIPYLELLNAIQSWDPDVHLLMTKETHCFVFGQLNETALGVYCSRFLEEGVSAATFLATVNRCGDCVALGVEKRQDDSIIGQLSDAKCQVYMDKARQYKRDGWDVYYMSWCPQVVQPRDVQRITDSNFCDADQQLRLKDNRFTTKLKDGILRKIGEKLVACIGQLNTWTNQQISDFAPYIVHLPKNLLKQMTVTQFAANLNSLVRVPNIQKTAFLRVLGYKIATWWAANNGDYDADTQNKIICIVVKYAPDKQMLKLLTEAQLQTAIGNFQSLCSAFDISPEDARGVIMDVVSSAGFTWTADTIGILGKFIGRLPGKIIKDIPTNVVCPNWASINTADIGRAEMAFIWEKCSSSFPNPNTYDCNKLQEIGVLLQALPKSYVNEIPDAVLAECIQNIAPILEPVCKRRKGLCKLVMRKIKAYADANNQKLGTYINQVGEYLGRAVRDYASVAIADLGGIDSLKNLDFTENKAASNALWKKVKAELGAVTHDNIEYCGEKFTRIAKIFFAAANEQEWENLCEDESIMQNIARAGSMLEKLSGRVVRAIVKKLLRLFGASGNVKRLCIDGPLIEQVAIFLPRARGKDLAKFSRETLKHVVRVIGSRRESIAAVTRSQMKFLTQVAVKTEGTTTSITVNNMDDTGPFAWCGIVAADVSKLPDAAIVKYGRELLQCDQFDFDTNTALVKRHTTLTNSDGPSVIEEYGEKFMYALNEFPASQLTTEMKETLAAIADRLMEKLREARKKLGRRDNREVSAAEKDRIKALRKQMTSRMFDIVLEVKASGTRRKRSAANADCSILSSFAGNLDFLTDTQINSFATTEVKSCLAQLSTTVWDSAQCTAWRTHLIHTDGLGTSVSSWTKTDIQALGTLVDCLTSAEVQSLDVDDEVIQALGSVELAKAADVMIAYLAKTGTDLATIGDEALSDMGNMVCGLTSTQIGDIPQNTVHGTAKDLNDLGCMDSTQLAAVGSKIVAVEGSDWSSKDPAVVGEFGTFVGGLQQSVLSTFTGEHVKEISPAAVQAIPPATLANAFDPAAFAGMSTEQSNAITENQLNQLSPAQKQSIEENTSFNVPISDLNNLDNTGGGAKGFHIGLYQLLAAMLSGIIVAVIL